MKLFCENSQQLSAVNFFSKNTIVDVQMGSKYENVKKKKNCRHPVTFLERRLGDSCFPVDFVKFLRATFLQITLGQLLLSISSKLWRF